MKDGHNRIIVNRFNDVGEMKVRVIDLEETVVVAGKSYKYAKYHDNVQAIRADVKSGALKGDLRYAEDLASEGKFLHFDYSDIEHLTTAEQKYMVNYLRDGYQDMNAMLWGNTITPMMEAVVEGTVLAAQKVKKYEGKTYRMVATQDISKYDRYKVGEVVTEKAFISTADDIDDAIGYVGGRQGEKIMFEVIGKTGTDLRKFRASESEVLYMPGTKFKVTSRTSKVDENNAPLTWIKLKEV